MASFFDASAHLIAITVVAKFVGAVGQTCMVQGSSAEQWLQTWCSRAYYEGLHALSSTCCQAQAKVP